MGCVVRLNGDTVFVSIALPGMIVALQQVSILRWKARLFVDLGTIEVAPFSDDYAGAPIEPVITVNRNRTALLRKRAERLIHAPTLSNCQRLTVAPVLTGSDWLPDSSALVPPLRSVPPALFRPACTSTACQKT